MSKPVSIQVQCSPMEPPVRVSPGMLEMVPAMLLANLATLLLATLITVLASTTGIMSLAITAEELCISLAQS